MAVSTGTPRATPNATARALATIVTLYRQGPTPTYDPVVSATAAAVGSSLLVIANGEPETGPAPLEVKFGLADYNDIDIDEAKFHWDFGDGSPPSTERRPVHVFERPGRYRVRLMVTVGDDMDKDWVDVIVLPGAAGER